MATGLGFLGFYGVGRTLAIDLQNLGAALLVIFGGAFIGCAAGMVPLFLTKPLWSLASHWNFLSPFILQISFMAFTAVSLAHFRLQGLPLFQFIRRGIRRRGTEPDSTEQSLFLLFVVVFFLGIIKDVLYWATLLWVQDVRGLIIFWLGIGGMFFGWYWEDPKIKLDLTTNLPLTLLALLGGAYGGSAVIPLLLEIGHWILVSPWFLQIFFMAFTVVSMAHLQSQ